jgi:hypothetical protein
MYLVAAHELQSLALTFGQSPQILKEGIQNYWLFDR